VKITILGTTPSVNSLYAKGRHGNIYLTQSGRIYKKEVGDALRKLGVELPEPLRDRPLRVRCAFAFERLWERPGHPVRLDVDNRLKVLLDALAEALDWDDKWVWEIVASKHEGPVERVVVELERLVLS